MGGARTCSNSEFNTKLKRSWCEVSMVSFRAGRKFAILDCDLGHVAVSKVYKVCCRSCEANCSPVAAAPACV